MALYLRYWGMDIEPGDDLTRPRGGRYTNFAGGGGQFTDVGTSGDTGPFGGGAYVGYSNNATKFLFGQAPADLYFGFHVQQRSGSDTRRVRATFHDSIANIRVVELRIHVEAGTRNMLVLIDNVQVANVDIESLGINFGAGVWFWVSGHIVTNGASSHLIVNINDIEVYDAAFSTAGNAPNGAVLWCETSSTVLNCPIYKNLIIHNGEGSSPFNGILADNNFDVRSIYPTSDISLGWVPSTGTTGYEVVDEARANATDYVSQADGVSVTRFGFNDWTATKSLLAIQPSIAGWQGTGTKARMTIEVEGVSEFGDFTFTNTSTNFSMDSIAAIVATALNDTLSDLEIELSPVSAEASMNVTQVAVELLEWDAPFESDLILDYALISSISSDLTLDYVLETGFESDIIFDYRMPFDFISEVTLDYTLLETKDINLSQLPLLTVEIGDRDIHISQLPMLVVNLPDQAIDLSQLPVLLLVLNREVPLPLPNPVVVATTLSEIVPEVPVTEIWSYLTVISQAWNSREQRSALRETPRIRVEFEALILNNVDKRSVYDVIYRYIDKVFYFPLYQYSISLTAAATTTATKIFLDPTKSDFRDGELVALFNPSLTKTQLVEIATVDADGLTLADPLPFDVSQSWLACPAASFRFPATASLSMANIAGSTKMIMESVLPRTIERVDGSALLTVYDSLVVLDRQPIGDIDEEFNRGMFWYDVGTSIPIPKANWPVTYTASNVQYKYDRFSDSAYWRALATHTKGRQNPVLLPSFRDDLLLVEDPELGAVYLVTDNVQANEYFYERYFNYIRIVTANGAVFRKVNDVIINYNEDGDAISLNVVLNTPLGVNTGDNVIEKVSYTRLVRLDSDEIKIEHYETDSFISFNVRTISE